MNYFYCNKNVDLSGFKPFVFTINEFNYNFTLTKDDLFLDVGDKYVFMMAFGGFSELILGYPFLKKYQLIFNQNTKTVGFYLCKFKIYGKKLVDDQVERFENKEDEANKKDSLKYFDPELNGEVTVIELIFEVLEYL